MRSAAKLSYEQAQAAIDGAPDDVDRPADGRGAEAPVGRLWRGEGGPRRSARRSRSSPWSAGSSLAPTAPWPRSRPRQELTAHKLIEEFMIQANVSAAETLEQRRSPLIYRVHEAPSQEKLQALADFLATLGIPWTKGETVRPDRFNRLLDQTRGGPHAEIVNEVVLRTQMQAHLFARQHRPFRPQPGPLRPFHLADPPLRRPHRPSRPDPRPGPGRRRPERRGRRAPEGHRRAHHGGRAPRHGRRARRRRPLCGRLPGGQGRRHLRGPDHRGDPLWPVRAPWPRPAPTAWFRSPAWAANISSTTTRPTPWWASAPARAGGWAARSRCACAKRRRSPAACCWKC